MMIQAVKKRNDACYVDFVWEKDPHIRGYKMGLENLFSGNYLDVMPVPLGGQTVLLAGCGNQEPENSEMKMIVNVNGQDFTATLAKNSAVDALVQMMGNGPVTLQLSDYAGFEKVGSLGQSLPASNSQTTTHAGDIVLYQGNQIVMFYGSNSWSYTRLGHIDDLTGWEEALGSGDVTVTLSMEN